jgi:alpha-glucosidase (family GH31 glycosyl hydrolase)
MRHTRAFLPLLGLSCLTGCGDDEALNHGPLLSSPEASVKIGLSPFQLSIRNAESEVVLETLPETGFGAKVDEPYLFSQPLPGWDGYLEGEAPWKRATRGRVLEETESSALLELEGGGVFVTVSVEVEAARVRLSFDATESQAAEQTDLNKTTLSFASRANEHFFGMGERFASVDHRGQSLYSWAEEGGIGKGEDVPPGATNPGPNGPSMTYFPVAFFLSNQGYAVHLATTFRNELAFASEREDAWRVAVNSNRFDATVYVTDDPLAAIDAYTEDSGRPTQPAPWVFGPRRRVSPHALVDGEEEWKKMRDNDIACTAVDDAVHFLPALSHVGREAELLDWTTTLHANGYKAMAYNNPYVAQNDPAAAADYGYGKEQGFFVKGPDGEPSLTEFISGKLLTVAAVDLTNPAAVSWYQGLLKRTLDLGYDGWMHDFGEYTARNAVFFDGRRGDEMHNEYPRLSAKAAFELMEKERPNDYLFFVRSGTSGTQAVVPAVWGGDAEATFDETQGLPSSVRGGVNLSMSGVPYWASDMTGFKCITDFPRDKEVFLRWVELGALSPIMMEQNACANPLGKQEKWKLWGDQETIDVYRHYARLHTRLLPYFLVLANQAHKTGKPLTLHPFLLHPDVEAAWSIDDAYYLGPALYVSPVVRRGVTTKQVWLPPGRFVDFDDFRVFEGNGVVDIDVPLAKLPLFLAEDQLLPLLDPSIDTLAPATVPEVVTLDDVADRLDVIVVLSASGKAEIELADGTRLAAERVADSGNPDGLSQVDSASMADCASCWLSEVKSDLTRLRVNGALGTGGTVTLNGVKLETTGGPSRRVRWDVLLLP